MSVCTGKVRREHGDEHGGPTENSCQALGGVEELGGANGIVLVGVNGHVLEGGLEGLDNGAAGGDDGSRHGCCVCGEMRTKGCGV